MRNSSFFALACALSLAACGGGDGGTPSTGGGGTPTPTPPPVTYSTYAELTGVQSFQTTCGGWEAVDFIDSSIGGFEFGNTVLIESDRDVPSYTVQVADVGLVGPASNTYTQAERDTSAPATTERYRIRDANGKTQGLSIFVPAINDVDLEYARLAQVITTGDRGFRVLLCAFGVPTVLTDVPAASINYMNSETASILRVVEDAAVVGSGSTTQYIAEPSVATGFADPTTGEIRFTIDLKGYSLASGSPADTATDLGTYTANTSIDGTATSFSDLLVNSDGIVVGTIGGWFFGPQGETMAVSIGIQDRRPDGSDIIAGGVVYLRR